MSAELGRLEEAMPDFLNRKQEVSQLRQLVNKWAEFREGLEVI
jgi:hypothetical protein